MRGRVVLTVSDSVSHLKTSIIGNSITLPIRDGKLVLGTWQGIYLAEVSRKRPEWRDRVVRAAREATEASRAQAMMDTWYRHPLRRPYAQYPIDNVDSSGDERRCCPKTRSLADRVGARIAVQWRGCIPCCRGRCLTAYPLLSQTMDDKAGMPAYGRLPVTETMEVASAVSPSMDAAVHVNSLVHFMAITALPVMTCSARNSTWSVVSAVHR